MRQSDRGSRSELSGTWKVTFRRRKIHLPAFELSSSFRVKGANLLVWKDSEQSLTVRPGGPLLRVVLLHHFSTV